MSDWQPARFKGVHKRPKGLPTRSTLPKFSELEKMLIFVRPALIERVNIPLWRACGCDAEKFYEVRGWTNSGICEHEILTD
jgi:hypothetical protein